MVEHVVPVIRVPIQAMYLMGSISITPVQSLNCCCPQYDVKLMWHHRGNDIVSVAAICAAALLIFLFGRTRLAV